MTKDQREKLRKLVKEWRNSGGKEVLLFPLKVPALILAVEQRRDTDTYFAIKAEIEQQDKPASILKIAV